MISVVQQEQVEVPASDSGNSYRHPFAVNSDFLELKLALFRIREREEISLDGSEKTLCIAYLAAGPVLAPFLTTSRPIGREKTLTYKERSVMNTDQMKGKFKQLSGEIKRKWGQVTDDDLTQAQGSMEKLVGKIQERSGDQREAIEKWLKQQGMN
jgi:uncharacterized protein YjbJ (UPF0337 family)